MSLPEAEPGFVLMSFPDHPDREIQVMGVCVVMLEGLGPEERSRVVLYLLDRMVEGVEV